MHSLMLSFPTLGFGSEIYGVRNQSFTCFCVCVWYRKFRFLFKAKRDFQKRYCEERQGVLVSAHGVGL